LGLVDADFAFLVQTLSVLQILQYISSLTLANEAQKLYRGDHLYIKEIDIAE